MTRALPSLTTTPRKDYAPITWRPSPNSPLADEAMHLKQLDPFIGALPIEGVHMGSLQLFITARRGQGVKSKTINLALGVVRRILNLASTEWLDENSLTWIESAPKIKLLPRTDARAPYPLSWDEQTRLFSELPAHLWRMALFKVNTGTREQEVCQLRWDWEVPVPELGTSVFIIPGRRVKNGDDRLVVLNRVARSVIDEVRGRHPDYVFTFEGLPITRMNKSAWRKARIRAGYPVSAYTISSIPSGVGLGRRVCPLRIGRTS